MGTAGWNTQLQTRSCFTQTNSTPLLGCLHPSALHRLCPGITWAPSTPSMLPSHGTCALLHRARMRTFTPLPPPTHIHHAHAPAPSLFSAWSRAGPMQTSSTRSLTLLGVRTAHYSTTAVQALHATLLGTQLRAPAISTQGLK